MSTRKSLKVVVLVGMRLTTRVRREKIAAPLIKVVARWPTLRPAMKASNSSAKTSLRISDRLNSNSHLRHFTKKRQKSRQKRNQNQIKEQIIVITHLSKKSARRKSLKKVNSSHSLRRAKMNRSISFRMKMQQNTWML